MTLEKHKRGFPAVMHISLTYPVGLKPAMHVNQSQPPTRSMSNSSRRLRNMPFFCWYEGMKVPRALETQPQKSLLLPWFPEQPISAHLPHTADTQIAAEANTGHGGRWLKQRGTQSDFLWLGCFCRLIISLMFIRRLLYALYWLCPSVAFCVVGKLYSFLNAVTTIRIRFVEKQTLHLKYPQCGQLVFTLPAANLISRLQKGSLFLPPVMWYIITPYKGTFMHEPFWRYLCQDLEYEKIPVQNAFNIRREGLNEGFDLAKPQHRSCILEVLRFEASAAQLTVACAFASLYLSPSTTKKSIF